MAARETLGLGTSLGETRVDPGEVGDPALRLAGELAALRQADDAGLVLERWSAGDARTGAADSATMRPSAQLVTASRIAFAAGRPRLALRFVERAIAALPDSAGGERWALVPWLYPPAYDSLFAAYPESAGTEAPDRALLQAVAWKESRFDVRARSRSDAIGLLQLKRPAIADVAASLHEPVPTDSAMLEPGPSLRYGALYLGRQLQRFPGNLPLALAAYNAGSRVAARWTRLRAIGGDALACEEIGFPETQDYVKTILAVRQAYRELRPVVTDR
jgi:soluble lytic murein transglycosylase-like protein